MLLAPQFTFPITNGLHNPAHGECACGHVVDSAAYAFAELLANTSSLFTSRLWATVAAVTVAVRLDALDERFLRVTSWDVILILSCWHWYQYMRVRDLAPHSQKASRILLHTLRTTTIVNNIFAYQVFVKTLLVHVLRLTGWDAGIPSRVRVVLLSTGSALMPRPVLGPGADSHSSLSSTSMPMSTSTQPPRWSVLLFTLFISLFALVPLHALLIRYPTEGMPVDVVRFQGEPKPEWYQRFHLRTRPYMDMRTVLRLRAQGVDVENYRLGRRPELQCDRRPSWM